MAHLFDLRMTTPLSAPFAQRMLCAAVLCAAHRDGRPCRADRRPGLHLCGSQRPHPDLGPPDRRMHGPRAARPVARRPAAAHRAAVAHRRRAYREGSPRPAPGGREGSQGRGREARPQPAAALPQCRGCTRRRARRRWPTCTPRCSCPSCASANWPPSASRCSRKPSSTPARPCRSSCAINSPPTMAPLPRSVTRRTTRRPSSIASTSCSIPNWRA